MRKRPRVIVATMILVLALATAAMAADPFVGTWKLNLAKSKFSPGPAPTDVTILKIKAQSNGFKWTFETVGADGKAAPGSVPGEWSGKYDGKDYLLKGNENADTVASRKIDANTLDCMLKKGGIAVGSGRVIVSKDGKTLTLTEKDKNAQGQNVNNTEVYDRQ